MTGSWLRSLFLHDWIDDFWRTVGRTLRSLQYLTVNYPVTTRSRVTEIEFCMMYRYNDVLVLLFVPPSLLALF